MHLKYANETAKSVGLAQAAVLGPTCILILVNFMVRRNLKNLQR